MLLLTQILIHSSFIFLFFLFFHHHFFYFFYYHFSGNKILIIIKIKWSKIGLRQTFSLVPIKVVLSFSLQNPPLIAILMGLGWIQSSPSQNNNNNIIIDNIKI